MQPTRVLVGDAYRDVADTPPFILEQRGFDARASYGAAEALDLCRAWNPDAVVLDIMLPLMNGHELAAAIRREVVPCPIFIAVTGYQHPALEERSRALGFAGHFMKPCDAGLICGILGGTRPARAA